MTAARLTVPSPLERIMIDRGRIAGPDQSCESAPYQYLEQIYRVEESPKVILIDPDLL